MKRISLLSSALFALAVAMPAGACMVHETMSATPYGPVGGPPDPRSEYDYYYYPESEVYFNPIGGVYWWTDGGTWVSGRELPPRIVVRNDERVSVRLHSERPWSEHEDVRRRYPSHAEARRGPSHTGEHHDQSHTDEHHNQSHTDEHHNQSHDGERRGKR
jgi:hypothetical protein